jgi:stage II sporulation protein P
MYVSGSNASAVHPNWQKNLSLIEKLHVVTEKAYPGVTRPINLRAKAYNQDLSVGSLLVEVGSAGNTHPEAMNAVPALAEAIIALAMGAG